jgi:hypothetical protein
MDVANYEIPPLPKDKSYPSPEAMAIAMESLGEGSTSYT